MKILTDRAFYKLQEELYEKAKENVSFVETIKIKHEAHNNYYKGYEEGKSLLYSVIEDIKKNFEKAKSSDEFCEWLYNSYLGGGKNDNRE